MKLPIQNIPIRSDLGKKLRAIMLEQNLRRPLALVRYDEIERKMQENIKKGILK